MTCWTSWFFQAHAEACGLAEQLIIEYGPQQVDVMKILEFGRMILDKKTPVGDTLKWKVV